MNRKTMALLFGICLGSAPASHALNLQGPGILANHLALSIFNLEAPASPAAGVPGEPHGGRASDGSGIPTGGFPGFGTGGDSSPSFDDTFSTTPEPTSLLLLLTGLLGIAAVARRPRRPNSDRSDPKGTAIPDATVGSL